MREADAIEFLRTRIGDEGYTVIGQVPDATGARQSRTMDALAVQCWPSRGLSLTAIEYKASRNDWRRELRNPAKADQIARYCDYMLILAPKGIVPIEELPPSWGLWEIHKTEKRCMLKRTKAPELQDKEPIDLAFLTAVLRARERYNGDSAKLEERRRKDREEMNRRIADEVKRRMSNHNRLTENVREFEQASGIKIANGWSLDKLGEGVAAFLKNREQITNRLQQQRTELVRLVGIMDEVLDND